MKKNIVFFCFLLLLSALAFSQSADKVTEMLNKDVVNVFEVAYFATTYLYPSKENLSGEEAYKLLEEEYGFPKLNETDIVTYRDIAYFCTRVWNIKTSIMSKITQFPRYAFRDLQTLGFVENTVMPSDFITGLDALTLMTKCADYALLHATIDVETLEAYITVEQEQNSTSQSSSNITIPSISR